MTAAKRGDLVVIQKHNRDHAIGQETREYDTFTVGVVTSVTRDGMVKMFKEAGTSTTWTTPGSLTAARPSPPWATCAP